MYDSTEERDKTRRYASNFYSSATFPLVDPTEFQIIV